MHSGHYIIASQGTIKEFLVLEIDNKRSKNKKLLELGLEPNAF